MAVYSDPLPTRVISRTQRCGCYAMQSRKSSLIWIRCGKVLATQSGTGTVVANAPVHFVVGDVTLHVFTLGCWDTFM